MEHRIESLKERVDRLEEQVAAALQELGELLPQLRANPSLLGAIGRRLSADSLGEGGDRA